MTRKILISLSIIGIVGAIAIGATVAYFNDVETSTGNIFVAGELDLKVDHTRQTYNDIDCKTCSVTVISDLTNMVIEKNGVAITSYPAVYAWVHPNWTSQNDPILFAAGAKWIWEQNPTQQADTTVNVTYSFEKDFEWWGPIVNTDLYMAVGSDNSVWVYLNNVLIGSNTGEFGYLQGSMLHISAANITANVSQGDNTLKFVVQNWGLPNGTPYNNPAGLIYKFSIDGLCGDDWFRNHCRLWGEKDLEAGDTFWSFDDIKPGDYGINVISLHVYDNDAFACLMAHNIVDDENVRIDPEIKAGDTTDDEGELSQFIKMFAWEDDGDGIYQAGELIIAGPDSPFAAAIGVIDLTACNTKYIGIAWCAGTQSVDGQGVITCDGSSMGDIAQTDIMTADFTAYAEQQRHNADFVCPDWDEPLVFD